MYPPPQRIFYALLEYRIVIDLPRIIIPNIKFTVPKEKKIRMKRVNISRHFQSLLEIALDLKWNNFEVSFKQYGIGRPIY